MVGSFWLNMDPGGPPGTRVMNTFVTHVTTRHANSYWWNFLKMPIWPSAGLIFGLLLLNSLREIRIWVYQLWRDRLFLQIGWFSIMNVVWVTFELRLRFVWDAFCMHMRCVWVAFEARLRCVLHALRLRRVCDITGLTVIILTTLIVCELLAYKVGMRIAIYNIFCNFRTPKNPKNCYIWLTLVPLGMKKPSGVW